MTHVFVTSGLLLVLERDNCALGLTAILVLLTRPLDPVDLGLMWRASLTWILLRLHTVSHRGDKSWESRTHAGLGELCPIAQAIKRW